MKNLIKIISWLLALLMIMSAISVLSALSVFADDAADETETTEGSSEENTEEEVEDKVDSSAKPLGNSMVSKDPETDPYLNTFYANPDEKIANMRLAIQKDGYALYVDDYSGEVACVNTVTGEKLFTNPYDVASSTGAAETKYEILSQIIVHFTDNSQGGLANTFNSYVEAAQRGQIIVENIKGGVRVEYTIGREQSKTLVPRLMSLERFQDMILTNLEEAFPDGKLYEKADSKELLDVQAFLTRYTIYSLDELSELSSAQKNSFGYVRENLEASDRDKARVIKDYPVVSKMDVCVFDATASEAEILECEEIILKYCPEYTYEELEWDHAITDYQSDETNPPVFRLALEYRIEGDGLSVRLPANGIRFNEALFTLDSIEVLPYMGAGNSAYEGFNFFPDGSGALFDFKELGGGTTRSIVSKVYDTDFAYHKISGTYQQPIRYPVFGIVEHTTYNQYVSVNLETNEETVKSVLSGAIVDTVKAQEKGQSSGFCLGNEAKLYEKYRSAMDSNLIERKVNDSRGFLAIIEEGDALASLTTYHAGLLSDYNTIKMTITPRPKDTYNLQESISVGSGGDFTIVCDRKYVGSYRVKYTLLSDTAEKDLKLPEGKTVKDYGIYDTSWMGMAVAYRDYLYSDEVGVLTPNTNYIENSIPLYIETFGAVQTTKKILSVPVQVTEALTTFEDIEDMYSYLSEEHGIKNINFKLTGYANGGMYYSVPGKLDFEEAVGGNNLFQDIISIFTKEKDGFQKLLDAANGVNAEEGKNFGIYPDFDLVFQKGDAAFDGYRQADHAAKTIDDRYASRREYSATQQKYMNYFEIIISPAYFDVLYDRMEKNYADKYEGVIGISVSTLGEWLNSDFDEDEPYNREDSKQFTIEAFKHFDETYDQVMTSGGNAYVWKYADHILNMPLDSSRYIFSSNAVPFLGVVLHGSVNFAGEPLNMEGDMQYAILKAIENGAAPYFILSMDNTEILKEYQDLSKYYSIRYDIWKDDISSAYNTLNGVLGDVQNKYIIGHEFLEGGVRIPDADELESDVYEALIKDLEDEDNIVEILLQETKLQASIARNNSKLAEAYAAEAVVVGLESYIEQMNKANNVTHYENSQYYDNVKEAYIAYYRAEEADDKDAFTIVKNAKDAVAMIGAPISEYIAIESAINAKITQYENELHTAVEAYYAAKNLGTEYDYKIGKTAVEKAHRDYSNNRKEYYKALESLDTAQKDLITFQEALANAKTDSEKKKAENNIKKANKSIEDNTKKIATCQEEAPALLAATQDQELINLASLYYKLEAAETAHKKVINCYYQIDFDEYAEASYQASMLKAMYGNYKNAAISSKNIEDQQVKDWYDSYVESKLALAAIDEVVTAKMDSFKKAQVDNYVDALACVMALEELGYNDGADAGKLAKYNKAVNTAKSARNGAVNSAVALKTSVEYKNIQNYFQNIDVHMLAAIAAIDALVEAENEKGKNIEIKYIDKATLRIENEDEIALQSDIVMQAIERAKFVYNSINRDTYSLILDGRATDMDPIDGYEVRSDKDDKGNTYYFYGEYEKGYSYFTLDAEGNRVAYILPNSEPTSTYIDGIQLREIKINNQKIYFTASAENGYTYYVKDDNYDRYVLKDAVVYNGVEVEGSELVAGTKIYFDADQNVYYSVNEDGSYNRYTRYMAIKDCYAETIATVDERINTAFEMMAKCAKHDATFAAEVNRRIEFANASKEEEVVETETVSRYDTDNIVAVTYGEKLGDPYKTVILNYNNYTVNITYDHTDDGIDNGKEYTIPAYSFVVIEYKK